MANCSIQSQWGNFCSHRNSWVHIGLLLLSSHEWFSTIQICSGLHLLWSYQSLLLCWQQHNTVCLVRKITLLGIPRDVADMSCNTWMQECYMPHLMRLRVSLERKYCSKKAMPLSSPESLSTLIAHSRKRGANTLTAHCHTHSPPDCC